MTKMPYMRSIILVHILHWYIFVMETKADPEVCIEATYTLFNSLLTNETRTLVLICLQILARNLYSLFLNCFPF